MISTMNNRFLRGLVTWGVVLIGVLVFPFLVVIGAVIDTKSRMSEWWQEIAPDRRAAWRLMTFRSEA